MKRERIWSAGVAIALVALVAWSADQRWRVLASSPYPLGIDGYFYPVQVRAWLEGHTLQYPASPLTFLWMAQLARFTDPIVGAKLGAAIGGALIALPAYAVGARFGRTRGAGLVAAVLATTSAGSAYLTIEFVKQGIGLTVGLTALWLVLRALERPSRLRIGLAIAGFVAALATHKMAAGFVLAIAVPATIEEARGRGILRGRRLLYITIAAFVLCLVVLVLGLVAPQRFLSPHDAALLGGLLTTDADWAAPALATPHLTLSFEHEAAIGGALALFAAALLRWHRPRPRRPGERAAMWICIGLAVAIALPWLAVADPQGLGFRLRVAAFVPLALCASIATGVLGATLDERVRDAVLVAIAIVLLARTPHTRNEGRVDAHPALVAAVMATHVPAGKTAIVPERHILYMVAWYTRAPVSLRPDHVPPDRRVRVMPLAFIGMGSKLDHALDDARVAPGIEPPVGMHPRHRNGLVLVTEKTWEWLMSRAPDPRWSEWPTI